MENQDSSRTSLLEQELKAVKEELKATQVHVNTCKQESLELINKVNDLYTKTQRELVQVKHQLAQLRIYKFGLERFSTDNDDIKFYTGFPSYQHLTLFYNLVRPSAENMTYCYASGVLESRPACRALPLIDELFMFLVRIKLGLFEQDLAHRFSIHISSVSRKIITWANYLYFSLGSQPIWPSRTQVSERMPKCFRTQYPSTRVILDCTEIFVQTPSSLLLQSQLYSSYKSNTTLKALIGIAPHGAITFISSLYTGAISDKEITRCSGILDLYIGGTCVN